jgi:Mn2+/Fe2+ NRAMP family transporter
MVIMMLVATKPQVMGRFVLSPRLFFMGWLSTAAMALAAMVMIGSWFVS